MFKTLPGAGILRLPVSGFMENKPRRVKDGILNAHLSVIITYEGPCPASQFDLKLTINSVRFVEGVLTYTLFGKICTSPFSRAIKQVC